MALPKVVRYTKNLFIPSLKREVAFEPFTTADEKAIILLDENSTIYDKIKLQCDIISKCCQESNIDFMNMPVIEISYIFLQLRKISVGGTLDLKLTCPDCKTEIPISINIDLIKFETEKLEDLKFNISTSDGPYIVRCSHIQPGDLKYVDPTKSSFNDAAVILRTMYKADGNNVIDLTYEEKIELFDQLDASIAEKMVNYAQNGPMLKYDLHINCPECGKEIETKLQDFFI